MACTSIQKTRNWVLKLEEFRSAIKVDINRIATLSQANKLYGGFSVVGNTQIKIKCVSKRYTLKFLLLELKQELIQGIIIDCIIHKVRLDNQNNFFRIKKKNPL